MIPVLVSALLAVGSLLAGTVAALVCLVFGNLPQALFFFVLGGGLFVLVSPKQDELRRASATLKYWREVRERKRNE